MERKLYSGDIVIKIARIGTMTCDLQLQRNFQLALKLYYHHLTNANRDNYELTGI